MTQSRVRKTSGFESQTERAEKMKSKSFTRWSFSGAVLLGLFLTQVAPGQSSSSNLWLSITAISNNTVFLSLTNTISDIQYEIQSKQNLASTQWVSEGFMFGSEITNFTGTNVLQNGRANLFLRIRSWMDSYDMGIPDWWQLQYFGVVGIDPYGDPAGDGYSNLYKYQHGLNPFTFYAPQFPVASAIPAANDSKIIISWDQSQGAVVSYTIYRNGSAIATVPSSQLSYTDNSETINLTDPNDSDFPTYQVEANYSGASYLGGTEQPLNPKYTIATAIARGPQGQYILLVPNIPNGVSKIRVYIQVTAATYPDDFFNSTQTYQQPETMFTPTLSVTNFDVPVSSFTNAQYGIPSSLMPYYGSYGVVCRAIDGNEIPGPASTADQVGQPFAESQISAFVPFVDATEQLKENLAFQLESADGNGTFAFTVNNVSQTSPTSIVFPQNCAAVGFFFLLDFGLPQYNYAFIDPFKPFEDNYFYRNFVYASTNVNANGSLTSGVSYNSSVSPPIQIPNQTLFSFPEYNFVSTGNTNLLSPQMSATACAMGIFALSTGQSRSRKYRHQRGRHQFIFGRQPVQRVRPAISDGQATIFQREPAHRHAYQRRWRHPR